MGADLMERLQKAGVEAAGQRRNVTVLFTDLTGYTSLSEKVDTEDLFELVQRYIHMLINDVYKYEGIVDKLTGDGLMALFGAPIAHENNAERAIRAALDMQADVHQLSKDLRDKLGTELRMRVGLHAGSVVMGGIGSNLLMNYTAIGDTVNLARRIEEAAPPGSILTSETVYRQTRALFDFTQVTVLNPKGITHPVLAYRVLERKVHPGLVRGIEGLHAPMIGRDSELNRLKLAVNNLVTHRQGQFALITGEAGLGKSRLTAEFRASLTQSSVRVLEGQSLTYRRAITYWVFQDLLLNYLGAAVNTPEEDIREQLKISVSQALGARAPEYLPYLEQLLNLTPSDLAAAERIRYLDAGQLRQQIFLAVRNLLLAEAQRMPLIIILEDLHWADESSLELIRTLVESLPQAPMLIVAITRQAQGESLLKAFEWAQQHLAACFHPIQLQNLSQDQSEQLLNELLSIPDLPEKFRSQIIQRASGIPFYLEEILRMLMDAQAIQNKGGRWQLVEGVDISALGVPDTLQELILTRFDRLVPAQRRVLQVASVMGKDFNLSLLQAVLKEEMNLSTLGDLRILLGTLEERDFVRPQPGSRGNDYTFRHILMSDAIYSTILRKERSKLHGKVGETIEQLYAGRLENQIELLANHYRWSSCPDRALYYLILAGEKSARGYANDQARQYFEAALEILPQIQHTSEQAIQTHCGLGDVRVLTGDYVVARNHFQTALEAAQNDTGDNKIQEMSAIQRKIGTTFERQGEYDEAIQHLGEAQQLLEGLNTSFPMEKALILNDIGWIQFRRGNLDEALQDLLEALSLLENTTQYDVIASIYNRLGGVYYQKDQLDQASSFVRKSLVLRQEIGDTVAVARSYNNLGLLGWKKGDWDNALENFKHSVDLHADLGDVEGTIELHSNLGLLLLDRGNIDEAIQHLQTALSKAEQIGHTYHIGILYFYFCHLYVTATNWTAAIDYGNRSLEALQGIGAQDDLVNVYTYLGFSWLGLGDIDRAEDWGRRATELSNQLVGEQSSVPDENRGWTYRLLGEIAFLKNDLKEAEKLYKNSAAMFNAIGNQIEQGRALTVLARLSAAKGELASARVMINEARLIFQQLGARLDLRKLDAISANILTRSF